MRRRTLGAWLAAGALLLSALPAPAGPAHAATTAPSAVRLALGRLRLSIERRTLDNGLRVVLDRNASAPTVSVALLYRVGARDEPDGQSGTARLLAAMAFEGTRHLQPGKLARLVATRGGRTSYSVDHDRTLFADELPANELALGLWVEAERMRWATLPASRWPGVRKVAVADARRALAEPLAHARLRLAELAFQGLRPYSHPDRGVPAELRRANRRQVQTLYRRYYAPDNAVLVIAGSLDPVQAMRLVHRYFDGIPRRKHPPQRQTLRAPRQTSERITVLESRQPESAALLDGWVIPASKAAGHDALELLARVLGDGESSRLYDSLVRVHGLARGVSAWTAHRHGPDLFGIRVLLARGANPDRVQKLVDAELARIGRRGPSAAELEKAKSLVRTEFLLGLQSNRQRAAGLADAEAFDGDARAIAGRLDSFESVTTEAIAAATGKYLTASHRTVVEIEGPGEAKHGATPAPHRGGHHHAAAHHRHAATHHHHATREHHAATHHHHAEHQHHAATHHRHAATHHHHATREHHPATREHAGAKGQQHTGHHARKRSTRRAGREEKAQ